MNRLFKSRAPSLPRTTPENSDTSSAVRPADVMGNGVRFDAVSVAYGNTLVLDTLNLTVNPGEIVALIGPSGSGKTTALRAVAGFSQPGSGRITIGGRDVTELAPAQRNIGMVVQNYALFPHMRVEDNVAFGLRARGANVELVRTQVPECLRLVGMSAYAKRFPRELSGGQQQRVAIARALAVQPRVLLLDEPLSALDAQIRRSMLDELAALHRKLPSLTILYVTHDQTEALTLADQIGIMRDGKLVAYGTANELYRRPPNRFAAEFLGRANILPATRLRTISDGYFEVLCGGIPIRGRNHLNLADGSDCLICVRPHDLRIVSSGELPNTLNGSVRSVSWLGDSHSIEVDIRGQLARLSCAPMKDPPCTDTTLALQLDPDATSFIPESPSHG